MRGKEKAPAATGAQGESDSDAKLDKQSNIIGLALGTGGYLPIPIKAGDKRPAIKGWQSARLSADDWQRWPHCGVGVLTGQGDCPVVAVDMDILDKPLAESMERWCLEHLGVAPVRIGQAPKRLLVYRAQDAGWKKAASATFTSPDGTSHRVEILGDGQQFVAYGIHPGTGKPYQWIKPADGLLASNATELTEITADQVNVLLAKFEQQARAAGFERAVDGSNAVLSKGGGDGEHAVLWGGPPLEHTDEEIKGFLAELDPGDYEVWLRVGMALHYERRGGPDGLALWDEWSTGAHNYVGLPDLEQRWSGFGQRTDAPVTLRSVIRSSEEERDAALLPEPPFGYRLSGAGAFLLKEEGEDERLSHAPVFVMAISRDGGRENWGMLVKWRDRDGHWHGRAIPAGHLHRSGSETAEELANAGLAIVPGKEKLLLRYLAAFHPKKRLTAVTATGWREKSFVLPDRTIHPPDGEEVVFQPVAHHAAADSVRESGTLNDWQRHVATPAGESDLCAFAVAVALAAPLCNLVGQESGGFHLYGTTSRGKTTMLQAAASVWGCGADPAAAGGADTFVERWNMTANATEGLAETRNDLVLILDEVGETDAKDFGRTVYRIVSGSGKGRATRDGGLRKRRSWRLLMLSAGEVRVSQHIREGGGTVRGGQLVRMVELPAEHIFPDAETTNAMKAACAQYYGKAGPAFLESVTDDLESVHRELSALDEVAAKVGEVNGNEAGRVRQRFALVALAGELAIKAGVVPWQPGRALDVTRSAYAAWTENRDGTSEAARGVARLRAFIEAHGGSRFQRDLDMRAVINRAGWCRDGYYHFTIQAFEEACGGVLPDTVKRALRSEGLLRMEGANKLSNRISVEGQSVRVVSVRAGVLGPPTSPTKQDGVGEGATPHGTSPSPTSPSSPTEYAHPTLAEILS